LAGLKSTDCNNTSCIRLAMRVHSLHGLDQMIRSTSAKSILEILTNVALVAVSALIIWSFATRPGIWLGRSARAGDAVAVGTLLGPPSGYSWASHSRTLMLAIREGCMYCKNSVPFYRRLSDLRQKSQLRANFLAVMPDSREAGAHFLAANNIGVDAIYSLPLSDVKVSGTPTLLLLDNQGRIENAWVGQLHTAQEYAVIAALQK
jgi:hypothetical protein